MWLIAALADLHLKIIQNFGSSSENSYPFRAFEQLHLFDCPSGNFVT